jgi:type II secretory ATPase GspE/PulE/Tfp pilus assembly ATPase PilB-like protein
MIEAELALTDGRTLAVQLESFSARQVLITMVGGAPPLPIDNMLVQLLGRKFNLPIVDLTTYPIDPAAITALPREIIECYGVLPIAMDARRVTVAISDPLVRDLHNILGFTLRTRRFTQVLAPASQLRRHVAAFLAGTPVPRHPVSPGQGKKPPASASPNPDGRPAEVSPEVSTLHTNGAPETVGRLLDMGLDPFNFADALLGVLAQRLARRLCKECKRQTPMSQDDYDHLSGRFGEAAWEALVGPWSEQQRMWTAVGCPKCAGTGYKGRVALHELMVADDALKPLIQQRRPVAELRAVASGRGMQSLVQDGISKVLAGDTDLAQVLSVCSR